MVDVDIKRLGNGVHHLQVAVNADDIDLIDFEDGSFPDPIFVNLTLAKWDDDLTIEGIIKTNLLIECSRCLKPCLVSLEVPLKLFYKRKLFLSETDTIINLNNDDLMTLSYDENIISLDYRIRESLILSVPMKVLCENDCRGLCPVCGIDLNHETCTCRSDYIDPRWAALRQVTS